MQAKQGQERPEVLNKVQCSWIIEWWEWTWQAGWTGRWDQTQVLESLINHVKSELYLEGFFKLRAILTDLDSGKITSCPWRMDWWGAKLEEGDKLLLSKIMATWIKLVVMDLEMWQILEMFVRCNQQDRLTGWNLGVKNSKGGQI